MKTLFLILALAGAAGAQTPARIRLATVVPRGSSIHQALLAMGDEWHKAPGGPSLTIYPDGQMGGEAETVRRMRINQIQVALMSVAGLSEIDHSAAALQLMPGVFRSLDEVDYVRDKLKASLNPLFERKGFVVLCWNDAGWVRLFTKKPAVRPVEFKKLKVFALSSDTTQVDLMKAAGYQPVPLEYTDTLTGLQTGLIDAVPTTPFYALAGQFYGPAPHMLELNYTPLVGGLVILKSTWDSFSASTRTAIQKAAEEAGARIQQRSRQEMREAVEAMTKRGLHVHSLTTEEEAEWRANFEAAYPQIRGKLVPADMFDEVQRLLREYRK
jgi:TRAP-type transport system periplasmic protein